MDGAAPAEGEAEARKKKLETFENAAKKAKDNRERQELINNGDLNMSTSSLNYYYVTTKESDLNVRRSPGESGEKIGQITKGSVIEVVKISDGWAYVKYYNSKGDTKSGWVSCIVKIFVNSL